MKKKKDIYEKVNELILNGYDDNYIITNIEGVTKKTLVKWINELRIKKDDINNDKLPSQIDIYDRMSDKEVNYHLDVIKSRININNLVNCISFFSNLNFGKLDFNKDK